MKEILNAPDSIPQSVLDKADCVVILPSVLKFAFIFGGSYGRGVMTCRGSRGHELRVRPSECSSSDGKETPSGTAKVIELLESLMLSGPVYWRTVFPWRR
jgi:hypothetical protein